MLPSSFVDTTQTHGVFSCSNISPPTQAHIDILRYTWEHVCTIRLEEDDLSLSPSYAFGLAFFNALYEADPTLEFLFTNIVQQARAFAGMMACLVRIDAHSTRDNNPHLGFSDRVSACCKSNPVEDDFFKLKLQELGARHFFYNVSLSHLDLIGPALSKALETRLRQDFLPKVKEAWEKSQAYAVFYMKIGLESAQKEWQGNQRAQERQGCLIQ